MGVQESTGKPQWRATALAIAAAVLLGVSASDARALALGPITVQSALGEPLRAEIDIPDINADELASLKAGVAAPDAFRVAGLEYNPALAGIRITLERRPDGRHFLRLFSDRAVNDPFLDLILETSWSSGRIVRDYTMLFDPPRLRQSAPATAAQVSPVAPATRVAPAPAPSVAPAARAPAPSAAAAARSPAPAPSPRQASPVRPPPGDGKQVTVQGGDTAGKIAAANKPANISLDQMLVALLRANPDAFIGGNVNRLKAGAVLEVPSAEQAEQAAPAEASQTVVAQSRDFNEFRRRLAEGMPATRIGPAERQASGKVQASVEDKRPGAAAPDKLTLSKGAAQAKGGEDKIARDRAAQDASTRLAELNKNIADLNKLGTSTQPGPAASASAPKPGIAVPLGAASSAKPAAPSPVPTPVAAASAGRGAVAPPAATAAPAAPAIPASPVASAAAVTAAAASAVPAPAAATASAATATPAGAAASAPEAGASAASPAIAAASAAQDPASAAAAVAARAKPKAAPAPVETSLVDDLLDNPIVPATLGAVLALLLGFGFYRARQRRKSTQVDSSFLESRLQPDSFFGASGGQRIDTNDGAATGSSMVYSPSQLDAAGDVDPVAEADVYLAYGRDLQAEEILKEALRTTPQRVAIHAKLLEIYSKRRDAKAFEQVASQAYGLTHGDGPEWEHICQLGQELDSGNPLYRPGGQPPAPTVALAAGAASSAFERTGLQTQPMAPASELDLDLDFSLGDDEPAAPASTAHSSHAQAAAPAPAAPVSQPMPSLDMDFGSATAAFERPAPAPPASADAGWSQPGAPASPDLVLDDSPSPSSTPAAPAPAADPGMIEFDLGALSLDLDSAAPKTAASAPEVHPSDDAPSTGGFEHSPGADPLATKLALAEEFNAIGDPDGARSLAKEVLAEASGDLKSRAQRFLAEIS
jgi:pilus assembly protein FimV